MGKLQPCHVCGEETKYRCKSCRLPTCDEHLTSVPFSDLSGYCKGNINCIKVSEWRERNAFEGR